MNAAFRKRIRSRFRSAMTSSETEPPQVAVSGRDSRQLAHFLHCVPPMDKGSQSSATYAGSLEWLRKHRYELNTALQFIRRYPKVIQDDSLDGLWDFLLPFIENPQARAISHSNLHSLDLRRPLSGSRSPMMHEDRSQCKRVFLCCPRPDQCQSVDLTKVDILINTLLPFCYVRSSTSLYAPHVTYTGDKAFGAMEADVMVFLINKVTLRDPDCLSLLGAADAANIPILMVRERGFSLPQPLPNSVTKHQQTTPVKNSLLQNLGPFLRPQLHPSSPLSKTSSDTSTLRCKPRDNYKPAVKWETRSIADVVAECFASSLVYDLEHHGECTEALFERLTAILGHGILPVDNIGLHHSTASSDNFSSDLQSTSTESNDNSPSKSSSQSDKKEKVKHKGPAQKEAKSGGRFSRNILPRRRSKAKVLPPLEKAKSLETESETSAEAPQKRKEKHRWRRELGFLDDYGGPYAGMGTTFLLFRKPNRAAPEVVHWPTEVFDRDSSLTSFSDDSDVSLSIDIFPGELDLRSTSTTPEL